MNSIDFSNLSGIEARLGAQLDHDQVKIYREIYGCRADGLVFDEFTDLHPHPMTNAQYAEMTAELRAKLAAKAGRKHIWLQRESANDARLYARHNVRLRAERGTVRISYFAANEILRACDKRFAEETAEQVARELSR